MKRIKRNPRGDNSLLIVGILAIAGVGGYLYYTSHPSVVQNLVNGTPAFLPNGTANPGAAPWKTDTGYTTSPY